MKNLGPANSGACPAQTYSRPGRRLHSLLAALMVCLGLCAGAWSAMAAAPTISCPGNITVTNDPGKCFATVPFTVNSGGTPTPVVTCTMGSTVVTSAWMFAVGTNVVTCTATNGTLPNATCSFTVIVRDVTPPQFTNCVQFAIFFSAQPILNLI